MKLSKLTDRLFIKIPQNIRDDLSREIDRMNLLRSRLLSAAVFIVETAVMPFFFASKRGDFWENRDPIYIGIYTFLAAAMAFSFALSLILEKHRTQNGKWVRFYTSMLSVTILSWCAAIALLDQLSSGQMVMYVAAVFTVSVFPLLPPAVSLSVYLPVHALFLALLPVFHRDADLLFGNIVDTSICVAVAFVISWALYRSKCSDIVNKFIIQEKNKELNEINEKLLLANKRLERFSFTDSLTGLLNRRKLDERLLTEWEKCKSRCMPLSLLILDIDCFKRVNDVYGHQTGDVCLMRISDMMNLAARDTSDIVARWGGEEFIMVLPGAGSEKAYCLAEQIRKEVESMNDTHNGFGIKEKITVSIGVSTAVPSDDLTVREMIEAADKALYKAKSNKGNRTEHAGESMIEYKKII